MQARRDVHPAFGWAAVLGVVLIFDAVNQRSLTSYARAHPAATWLVGGLVSGHLLGAIPIRLDPFAHAGRVVRRPR